MPFRTISDAELEVMKVLWAERGVSANAIIDRLAHTSWSPATIRTLIGRLVKKTVLTYDKSGREYLYTPQVSESDYVRHARRSLLGRMYEGAVQPMIAQMIEEEELTQEEIVELQRLLEEKRRQK
jgi:BlaI family penicillinase repressor